MLIFLPVFFASFRQPCFVQRPLLHHTDGSVAQLNRRKKLHGDLQVKVNVYLYVWVWVVELLAKVVCFCTKLLLFLGLEHFAWGSKIIPSQECKAFLKKFGGWTSFKTKRPLWNGTGTLSTQDKILVLFQSFHQRSQKMQRRKKAVLTFCDANLLEKAWTIFSARIDVKLCFTFLGVNYTGNGGPPQID